MLLPKILPAVFLVSLAARSLAAIAVPVTGVYDDSTNANSVDAVAGVGLVSAGSAGETALNGYKSLFAGAFASNTGGVIRFDGWSAEAGDATGTLNSAMSATYGLGSTLSITRPTGEYQFDNSPAIDALGAPISGNMYLRTSGESFHILNFGTPLSAVGITVLSRNFSRTVLATVTYLNGTTATISNETVGAGANLDDTFFGFTAPAGNAIVSLRLETTASGDVNNNFFAIDDLAFVTSPIPEPSVALLGTTALAGFAIRRRRA